MDRPGHLVRHLLLPRRLWSLMEWRAGQWHQPARLKRAPVRARMRALVRARMWALVRAPVRALVRMRRLLSQVVANRLWSGP